MSIIHPIAIYLTDADIEASIISEITDNSRILTVIRRCADVAELEAVARAGLAKIVAVGAHESDVDRQLIERLHAADVRILLLTHPHALDTISEPALRAMGADAVSQADQPAQVLSALHALAAPEKTSPFSTEDTTQHDFDTLIADLQKTPPPPRNAQPHEPPTDETNQQNTTHALRNRLTTAFQTAQSEQQERKALGQIIAIYGTSGAPGRTTLAINLAAELTTYGRVLLIDADTHAPSIAHALGINVDGSSLAALARVYARGSLNVIHCEETAYDGPKGLQILTGLNTPHRWRELSPSTLNGILNAARQGWDYIVVDLAAVTFETLNEYQQHLPHRDAVIAQAIQDADQIIVVARADAIGLHRLSYAWEWLDEHETDAPRLPVINMADTHRSGPQPRQSIAVALSELIPNTDVTLLPYDTAVLHAVLRGQILNGKAKKNARAALQELAQRVVSSSPPQVSNTPSASPT